MGRTSSSGPGKGNPGGDRGGNRGGGPNAREEKAQKGRQQSHGADPHRGEPAR